MAIREETVWEALKQVRDPEIGLDLVNLGLIYEIVITEREGKSDIDVKMTLTSPACPSGPQLVRQVKDVLRQLSADIGEVTVEIVLSPPWTPDRMSEEARDELGFY
mgnify:FL=1